MLRYVHIDGHIYIYVHHSICVCTYIYIYCRFTPHAHTCRQKPHLHTSREEPLNKRAFCSASWVTPIMPDMHPVQVNPQNLPVKPRWLHPDSSGRCPHCQGQRRPSYTYKHVKSRHTKMFNLPCPLALLLQTLHELALDVMYRHVT